MEYMRATMTITKEDNISFAIGTIIGIVLIP
jgi:hypothetical protein